MTTLFQSLQARLIFAFVLVTAVALAVAAGVFVAARKEDEERQSLDRVAAISPAVVNELVTAARLDPAQFDVRRFAVEAAARHKVRVIVFGPNQVVAADSDDQLLGEAITLPLQGTIRMDASQRPYHAFRTEGSAGDGLVFVEAALPQLRTWAPAVTAGEPAAERVLLAVPESTITRAWLDLLPALGVAAAVAFPVAILLAVLLARSIARPVHQLTLASQRMAEGSFEVDVQRGREDEIGRLSDAFATMANRVGATQSQMRQLVANVSHDLKTPLTSILGFSRALSAGTAASEDEVRHMGAVIEEEAQRLSARLNDLLLLSEIDAGRAMVEWAEVDLEGITRSVVERLMTGDDARWRQPEFGPALVVQADAAKLERLLENLVSNAVKFTSAGGVIAMRTFREPGDGPVCLEVANSAPGVEADELPRFFDRFYRADRARGGADGSGLGLAIARDLARLLGGSLDARLEAGILTLRLRLRASAGLT